MMYGFRSANSLLKALKRSGLAKYCLVWMGAKKLYIDKLKLDAALATLKRRGTPGGFP